MKKKFIVVFCLCMFFITGCWDRDELEDWGFVAAIGIDIAAKDKLEITFQITNPQVGTLIKSNIKEPPSEIITVPAMDIITAKQLVSTSVTRRLTLSHAVALVISEELASSNRFYRLLETTTRDRDIRGDLNIIVCRERAADFIRNNDPKLETRPTKFYKFMSNRWQDTGLVPLSTLNRFIKRTQSDSGFLFLTIYGTTKKLERKEDAIQESDYKAGEVAIEGGSPTEMIGSAVLKGGRMIGALTGEETQLVLLLRKKREVRYISTNMKDPLNKKYTIAANVYPDGKAKIKMNLNGSVPKIYVTVPLSVQGIGIPSFINYVTDLEKQKILKEAFEKYFEEEAYELIEKSQKEFKGDPFTWGYEAKKYFLTNKEWKEYDWNKKYPQAEVSVDFKVKIKNFGKGLAPPDAERVIDEE